MKIKMLTISVILSVVAVTGNAADPIKMKNAIINNAENMIRIEKYWTEDKLKNAVPLPLPKVSNEKLEELIRGKQRSDQHDESKEIQSVENSGKKALTPGVPVPANVSRRPFWNGGKLFFTMPGGMDSSCSAQFTGQNNILLTAGHCIKNGDTGVYYKNFMFIRAYDNRKGQQTVGWTCAMAADKWGTTTPKNYKYDYAFIHTNTKSDVGWLGLKTEIPYNSFTAIGYPYNYGYSEHMYKVDGNKGTTLDGIVRMTGNPMRVGASGGAWIAELTSRVEGGNFAVGLNSHFIIGDTHSVYGPLFDDQTSSLYHKTINNCK